MSLAVKEIIDKDGVCLLSNIRWEFCSDIDLRVKKACECFKTSIAYGLPVYVEHKNDNSEKYTLTINENCISIMGEGAAGAFYGLMTLQMLIKQNGNELSCCEITDYPDMGYRGFYQDITRGRIPTLDTLKKLVDMMAEYKMNSLQLYVEHCYEFKEYEQCRDELGYISKAEIMELDKYCKDRFIELIPSLSCFGHLYHLLQNDKYKHLCELKDYKPTRHYFIERIFHHTINPLLDESFDLITSLIDQHMEAFSSNYFNICCDETFDLGTDVNKDKNKGELYIGFVKKLIDYLESKGKTVMMWGDIVLEHSKRVEELSDNLIFLNWDYEKIPDEDKVMDLKDKKQIVCPGTSSWFGFSERPSIEEDNITKLAELGYKYNAMGILNTNWGDLGHLASIDMAMYGLILGAAVGWDKNTKLNAEFKQAVSYYKYGNTEVISVLEAFGDILNQSQWRKFLEGYELTYKNTADDYLAAEHKCEEIIMKLQKMKFNDNNVKNEFILAAEGYAFLVAWQAKQEGFDVDCTVDFDKWLIDYEKAWLNNSKMSELYVLKQLFIEKQQEWIKNN